MPSIKNMRHRTPVLSVNAPTALEVIDNGKGGAVLFIAAYNPLNVYQMETKQSNATSVQFFKSSQFGEIRIGVNESNNPIFVANDIAKILGYTNPRKAIIDHCKGVTKRYAVTSKGNQEINFIPESDVYRLIMRSKLPDAEKFQDWVVEEILPSIRRTGGYIASNPEETPEQIMARALLVAQETIDRTKKALQTAEIQAANARSAADAYKDEIKRQAPKVLFANAVEASQKSVLIGELARVLNQNGVNIGQNRLFVWLRENDYLCSKGELYNLPTQKAMNVGLFEVKKTTITKPDGTTLVTSTTKVTGKGQIYFVNKFLYKQEREKKGGTL